MGIFYNAVFSPPPVLKSRITDCRKEFDAFNIEILSEFLNGGCLREGLCVEDIVEDFRSYMDFYNMHFIKYSNNGCCAQNILSKHEERCRRQIDILLYGVFFQSRLFCFLIIIPW